MCTNADYECDEKINVPLTVFGSVIMVALLVLLNYFRSLVGVWTMMDGKWHQLIVLTPEFTRDVLPWINVSLGLALSLACIHVIYGRWMPATRWADLGLTVFNLVVLSQILHAGSLLLFTPAALDGAVNSAVLVVPGVVFRGLLWVISVCMAIGAVVRFVQLLRYTLTEPARSSA